MIIFKMKKLLILFMVLVFSSFVLGDIVISELDEEYTLGQSVRVNASIVLNRDIYGFFKLDLVCTDSKIEYFRKPLILDEDKKVLVEAEPLSLSSKILKDGDKCYVLASLLNQDNGEVMSERTNKFVVSSDFNVTVSLNKSNYKPGEKLFVDISVDTPDEAFSSVTVELIVDKKLSSYDSTDKDFTITYVLPSSVSSGSQEILLEIEDSYGNLEKLEKKITILSVPAKITNVFSRTTYYANQVNETFRFKPVLYDQGAGTVDDEIVVVRILNQDGKEVATDSVMSTTSFSMEFNSRMKPGNYKIVSRYEDITQESTFTVLNSDYVEGAEDEVIENELNDSDNTSDNDLVDEEGSKLDVYEDERSFNLWKWVATILIVGVVLYGVYSFGRRSNNPESKRENKFKKDKFFGLDKKEEKPKKKESHPKVVKADPSQHEEDEEF